MTSTRGSRPMDVPLDADRVGPQLFLPSNITVTIEQLLRTYGGEDDHEGIVYLGGLELAGIGAVALSALSPQAETTWGSFRTGLQSNTEVVEALTARQLSLVGQVHSHPGDWVDHSDGDDEGALVKFEGYWSIVVPTFARKGMTPIESCGVHVYRRHAFRRLTSAAIAARVHLVPHCIDLRAR
jgi:hypothetical protein